MGFLTAPPTCQHGPAPGPLHRLFPLLGTPLLQILIYLALTPPPGVCSEVTSSVRSLPIFNFHSPPPLGPHTCFPASFFSIAFIILHTTQLFRVFIAHFPSSLLIVSPERAELGSVSVTATCSPSPGPGKRKKSDEYLGGPGCFVFHPRVSVSSSVRWGQGLFLGPLRVLSHTPKSVRSGRPAGL